MELAFFSREIVEYEENSINALLMRKNELVSIKLVRAIATEEFCKTLGKCPLLDQIHFEGCSAELISLCAKYATQVRGWSFLRCAYFIVPKHCARLSLISCDLVEIDQQDQFFDRIVLETSVLKKNFVQRALLSTQDFESRKCTFQGSINWSLFHPDMKRLRISQFTSNAVFRAVTLPSELLITLGHNPARFHFSNVKALTLEFSEWDTGIFWARALEQNTSVKTLNCVNCKEQNHLENLLFKNRGITRVFLEGRDRNVPFAARNLRNHSYVQTVALFICWGALCFPKDMRRLIAQLVFASRFCPEWDNSFSSERHPQSGDHMAKVPRVENRSSPF